MAKMNSLIRLIVAICLIGLQVSAAPSPDAFETMFDQVFGSEARQLGAEETLKQLEIMVKSAPKAEKVPLENLVSASEMSDEDCRWQSLNAINLMMKSHSIYTVNVMPYLAHWRQDLFKTCAEYLTSDLYEASRNAFDQVEEDMTQLKEDMMRSQVGEVVKSSEINHDGLADLPRSSYAAGIVKFLERKLGPLDANMGRERFGFLLIQHLEPICGSVKLEFEPAVNNYESLLGDKQIEAEMSPFVFEWINNVRICRNIFNEFSSIVSEGHSLISGL